MDLTDRNKEPRKVTILLASPLPPPYSGYETITQYLLRSDLVKKFKIIHLNTSNLRPTNKRGAFDVPNTLMTVLRIIQLLLLLIAHRPRIADIPLAQNRTGFLKYSSFIIFASFFGCKIVSRLGGGSFDRFYERCSTGFQRYIKFVLNRINILTVEGEKLKAQFSGLVPEEKLRVVYSGIDTTDYSIDISDYNSVLKADKRDFLTVLFLGYVSKAKGALDLLRSVSKVVSEHKQVRFQFAGPLIKVERNILHIDNPNDTDHAVKKIIHNDSIQEYVEFTGEVVGQAKTEAFVGADVFVFPSYSEGFPFTILEAMASGLPIVTTPVGALPEVLVDGKNALFVKIGNPDDIAQKILQLIKDPILRSEMGMANRKLVEEKFNFERFSENMAEIFCEVSSR